LPFLVYWAMPVKLSFLRLLLVAVIGVGGCITQSVSAHERSVQPDSIPKGYYRNPVIPGDFADPSIIKVGNLFYAAGTSSEWGPHYPLFTSTDLVNWKQAGYIFNQPPAWTASSFWAPELFYYKNTFYVYYVAKRKKDNVSYIGVATAKDPLKGFTDHGPIIEYGTEAIDPFVIDDNGTLYMSFKAYGLDKRPIELLGVRLSADGLHTEGDYFPLLRDDNRKGMEGQVMIKKGGYYYIFYSAGNCCGVRCSYNVRVARSQKLEGPYEYYAGNPILDANDTWKCPGHGTLVQAYGGRYFYLYHAYNVKDNVYTGRQGMLDELVWTNAGGWPSFQQGASPSVSNVSPGHTTQKTSLSWKDGFDGVKLKQEWQWDFRHSKPLVKLGKGILYLSGDTLAGNQHTGIAITTRPFSGDYTVQVTVSGDVHSLDGLVLYGDAGQAMGIGVDQKQQIVIWEVKKGAHQVLATATGGATRLRLKMEVKDGYRCHFYWAPGKGNWSELTIPGMSVYEGNFLAPWDRSPRPGLIHRGPATESGIFSAFSINYQTH